MRIFNSPQGRSILSLLGDLFLLGFFGFTNLRDTLKRYNLCFVGPHNPRLSSTSPLYGTYRAFDSASYYFIKTPLDVSQPCLLPFCGWPDATTVNNIMSPQAMEDRNKKPGAFTKHLLEYLLLDGKTIDTTASSSSYSSSITTTGAMTTTSSSNVVDRVSSAIYWDQGHTAFTEGYSRWCLHSKRIGGGDDPGRQLEKYCSRFVPSVLADANKEPYFPELPLNPPPKGAWDDDVRVECFIDGEIAGMKEFKGKESLEVVWDLWKLPGSLILMGLHGYLFVKQRTGGFYGSELIGINFEISEGDIWKVVTGSFVSLGNGHFAWVMWNLWIIGASMEQEYGSLTFLYLHIAIIILVGIGTMISLKIYKNCGGRQDMDEKVSIYGYGPVIFAWTIMITIEKKMFPLVPYTDIHILTSGQTFYVPLLTNCILAFIFMPRDIKFHDNTTVSMSNIPFPHVIGIFLGVLLHYNWLPRTLLAPHILVTIISYVQLILLQKVIPLKLKESGGVALADMGAGGSTSSDTISFKLRCTLNCLRYANILCHLIGIMALDHGMATVGIAISILFYLGIESFLQKNTNHDTNCILTAFFTSMVVLIVFDAMSIGSWLASHIYIVSNPRTLFSERDICIYSSIRMILNVSALAVSAKLLSDNKVTARVFDNLFEELRVLGKIFWGEIETWDEVEHDEEEEEELKLEMRSLSKTVVL